MTTADTPPNSDRTDPVIVEVTIAAPVETVWRALREPAEIRRWFGWDYPGLDEEIEQIFSTEVTTASAADHVLDMGEGGRFALHPDPDGGTVVTVTRPAPAGSPSWDGIYDEINEGWLTFAQQLRFALERHPGVDRRTIQLGGEPTSAEAPDPLAVLDLSGTSTFNDRDVWFGSEHQLGVILPNHGDSLLIVGRPPAAQTPHGTATAIVSTYGLDDAEFERLRRDCIERWEAHYTDAATTK